MQVKPFCFALHEETGHFISYTTELIHVHVYTLDSPEKQGPVFDAAIGLSTLQLQKHAHASPTGTVILPDSQKICPTGNSAES